VRVTRKHLYHKDDCTFSKAIKRQTVILNKSSRTGDQTWKKVIGYVKLENLEEALIWGISREAYYWLTKTKQIGGRSSPIEAAEFADHILEGYKSIMQPKAVKEAWGEKHRMHDLQDKSIEDFHILVIGGKPKNLPSKNIKCRVTQIETDTACSRKGELQFSMVPDIVLMFKDFISHGAYWAFKRKAKSLSVPFVAVSGGFNALVSGAKFRGYDLSKYIVSNGHKSKLIEITKPIQEKPMDSEEKMQQWIHSISNRAKETTVQGGRKLFIAKNMRGTLSIIFKGQILEEGLKIAERRKYGAAKRGMLTLEEAEAIKETLDADYGFVNLNFNLDPNTVRKNVGYVQGTLPLSVMKRMSGEIKATSRAKKPKTKPEKIKQRTKSKKQEPSELLKSFTDLPDLKPEGKAIDVFLAELGTHLRRMDDARQHQQALYEKIQETVMENVSYVEQIGQLEEKVAELEEELNDWKQLATKKKK
jgi:hypothetical protein